MSDTHVHESTIILFTHAVHLYSNDYDMYIVCSPYVYLYYDEAILQRKTTQYNTHVHVPLDSHTP